MAVKTVGIIGAGISGLSAAKACKAVGLSPHIFEQSTTLGGIWSPQSKLCRQNMTTNLSRHTCAFSDHPWMPPKSLFPSTSQMGSYLSDYAGRFLDSSAISYSHRVTSASQAESGRWNVTWLSPVGAGETTFDYLIVASGFFSEPYTPPMAGFTGKLMHSSAYRDPASVRDKSVVIVGDSFSAAELAGEIAAFAKSVIHVHPRPFWIFPRHIPLEPSKSDSPFAPLDLVFYDLSKRPMLTETTLPTHNQIKDRNIYFKSLCGDQAMIDSSLDVPLDQSAFVAISDHYANAVRAGTIKPHLGRLYVSQEGALSLSSGVTLEPAEVVIMATGFNTNVPFFSAEIRSALAYEAQDRRIPIVLHHNVFHPSPLLRNAAFIGMYRGPYMGVIELQARLVARVFSGALQFPSSAEQQGGIQKEVQIRSRVPPLQFPHSDYVGLMHDIATELGQDKPATIWQDRNTNTVTPALFSVDTVSRPVRQLLDEAQQDLEAARRGKFISAAVYNALPGKWKVLRRLSSHTNNLPSGTFTGEASFSRGLIEVGSDECELKYEEIGRLRTDTGLDLDARRAYRYRYDSEQDRIDVFFDDLAHFHSLQVLAPDEEAGYGYDGSWEPWIGRERPGWKAVGTHWCSPDDYTVAYWFTFRGVHLEEFRISYKVKGPMKDYIASSSYVR